MKHSRLLPACLALMPALLPAGAAAEPARYVLDPEHSWVHFEVLHFGTSTLRGRIGPFRGEVVLDRDHAAGEIRLAVRTASVDTGLRVLDERLRQDDLLASRVHPEAYFVATQFRYARGQLAEVRGEFTWRGVSQPLSLRALGFACRTDTEAEVCGGNFEGEVLRSEFGATFGLPWVADRVRLVVQVEGRRQ